MPGITTAKDLLSSYNLLDKDEKKKYTHYEFQSFAYKIAKDLNDLENLKIYMMLAKRVERSLMERAYSYSLDAQTENRGKKFMWKLKELRKDLKDRQNFDNFEYSYVQKEMKIFRERLAEVFLKKNNNFDETLFGKEELPKNNKVLLINCINFNIVQKLSKSGYKISAIDSSRSLKRMVDEKFNGFGKLQPKVNCTDFFKNRFKEGTFDYIVFNESWCTIPVESEIEFLKVAKKLLKPHGKIQIVLKTGDQKEEWKKYKITSKLNSSDALKDEEIKYFIKMSSNKVFQELIQGLGLKVEEKKDYLNEMLYLLTL